MAVASGEFRRGWPVVVAAFIGYGAGVSSLPFYAGGLLAAALAVATGWSHTRLALGSVIGTVGVAASLPVVGWLIQRLGARRVAAVSLCGLAASFAALGLMTPSPVAYLAGMLAVGVLGCGSAPVAFTQVVGGWFVKRRGLALGLTLMGSGVAGLIVPLVLGRVMGLFGWRGGYFVLAAIACAAAPVVLLLLREPEDPPTSSTISPSADDPRGATFADAAGSWPLWLMTAGLALGALSIAGAMFHFVMILAAAGVGTADAARDASVLGASVILSRVATGFALDRIFAPRLAAGLFALSAVGCAMLRLSDPHLFLVAGLLIGLGMGGEVDIAAYLVSRYFGLRDYAKIYGLVYGVFLVFSGASPIMFGLLYDRFGGYRPALAVVIGLLLLASILLMFLPPFSNERVSRRLSDSSTAPKTRAPRRIAARPSH
jgi:MFS family permease